MTTTAYIVTPAPGCYGDVATVYSSHRTLAAARRAAGSDGRAVVRACESRSKGDRWVRADEALYPVVR